MITVRSGAVAPEAYVLDVTPGSSGVDLSTVTAAVFNVRRPDGTTTTWTATRSNQTSSTLKMTHTFVAADTNQQGEHRVYAALTIPSGTVRTAPQTVNVLPEYQPE